MSFMTSLSLLKFSLVYLRISLRSKVQIALNSKAGKELQNTPASPDIVSVGVKPSVLWSHKNICISKIPLRLSGMQIIFDVCILF